MLYGLKKGTETVGMSLANDATQAARLELRFAEERLDEVTSGAQRLRSDALAGALREMDERSLAGAEQLVLTAERTGEHELLAEVDEFVERQASGIVAVFARLPIEVRPYAEDSLATLRRIRSDLLLPALEACDCPDVVAASFSESDEDMRRMVSDPLPAADPEPEDGRASDSEQRAESTPSDTSTLSEPLDSVTGSQDSTSGDGAGSRLLEPLGETAEEVGSTLDRTVEDTGETVDRTTESVGDLLDDSGEVVGETTQSTKDAVDKTTDGVTDTLDSTTDSLGRVLGN
jgi:hypothetical protein